ncbi:hypothetical protein LguiB_035406 [Lonicera macranthoides]
MDRVQFLLVGLPLFLLGSDLFHLFEPPLPKPPHHQPLIQTKTPTLDFPMQRASDLGGGIGIGNTVRIHYCSSCSFNFDRGTAVMMKNMLENSFPGVNVLLDNYPPSLPKRLLAKVVPVIQFGVIGIVMGGEHIFPRLGFTAPLGKNLLTGKFTPEGILNKSDFVPRRVANMRFGSSFDLMRTISCGISGVLVEVFSKLKEHRFPGEIELKDLIGKRMTV